MTQNKERSLLEHERERERESLLSSNLYVSDNTFAFFCRYKNWVLKFQSKGCSASSAHMPKESPQDTQYSLLEATSELKLISTNSIT
jgi:hypothetical protein